jgi:hypothetical protein|tara:strand:+ start:754 stop:924 length:171 start_codon:yes stop_codon:yes gene_type:complete
MIIDYRAMFEREKRFWDLHEEICKELIADGMRPDRAVIYADKEATSRMDNEQIESY